MIVRTCHLAASWWRRGLAAPVTTSPLRTIRCTISRTATRWPLRPARLCTFFQRHRPGRAASTRRHSHRFAHRSLVRRGRGRKIRCSALIGPISRQDRRGPDKGGRHRQKDASPLVILRSLPALTAAGTPSAADPLGLLRLATGEAARGADAWLFFGMARRGQDHAMLAAAPASRRARSRRRTRRDHGRPRRGAARGARGPARRVVPPGPGFGSSISMLRWRATRRSRRRTCTQRTGSRPSAGRTSRS
jgi:hypothetical protein